MDAVVKLEEPSNRRKKHSLLQKIKEIVNSKKRNDQLVMDILFSVFVGNGLIEQLGGSASIQYSRQPNSVPLPPVEYRDENGQLRRCELIYLFLPNLPEGISTDQALGRMKEWDWNQELVASVPVPTLAPAAPARRQLIVVNQGVPPVGPAAGPVVQAGHHGGLQQPYEPVPTLAPAAPARRQQIVVNQGVPPVEQQPGYPLDMDEVAMQKYVEELIDKEGSGSREAVFNPNTNPVRIDSTFDSESAEKRRQKKGELQRRTEASLAKKSNNDDNVKQRSNNIRSMGMSEDQPQEQEQKQQQQQQANKGEKRNNDDVVEKQAATVS
jgi:hypothetical protein